ncbi:hypothetical protein BABA_01190 [Neobacillus bataviensis LMG 21833]|uniref:Uncharacterized protein n=1 Tax=Neobacillus bataviensis LMG 21833 TaxID=1117379 RepID=K6DG40_9BACI|nr:DUF6609 family protein [Neobacillus bataviensis]EKN71522.1 hypothetical protein BABA_01190 [Neobacillus bataviensis LMG 21833]
MDTQRVKYPNQRIAGLWFIWIGIIIILSAIFSNHLFIQPALFAGGFAIGFLLLYILPFSKKKLSYGEPTKVQKIASNASLALMVVLIMASVQWIGHSDLRTLWLSIFLAVGIHFVPFFVVHGKSLLLLALLTILCSILGLVLTSVPFHYFAYADAIIKIIFGIYLFTRSPEVA